MVGKIPTFGSALLTFRKTTPRNPKGPTMRPNHPFRVYMPNNTVHLVRRDPTKVSAEYPDAVRIERVDVRQPPQMIEDVSDE